MHYCIGGITYLGAERRQNAYFIAEHNISMPRYAFRQQTILVQRNIDFLLAASIRHKLSATLPSCKKQYEALGIGSATKETNKHKI